MTDSSDEPADDRLLLLATDGSDRANAALSAGLDLLGTPRAAVLVTVIAAADPSMLVGGGHAGPVMTPSEKQELVTARDQEARRILDAAVSLLRRGGADLTIETKILAGDPGHEICREAAERNVAAIVLGTRGQGGIKRALLGSVSDHVVRNAPSPVVTVNTA